jgi:phosphatidate cytidylyltransferase
VKAGIGTRRVLIGFLLAVIGIGSVFFPPLFTALVFVVALGSLYEFAQLSEHKGAVFAYPVALVSVALYIALTYFGLIRRYESVLLATTVMGALVYATFTERGNYFSRSAYTLLGVLYIGKLLSYFIEIRSIPEIGAALVIYVIMIVGITDVAAMAIGMRFGRTPLTRLSPKKTVEGAVGGLLAAIGFGVLFGSTGQLDFTWWQGVLVGAITSVAAQAGDIVESALKRDAHVKDAGTVIVGHGGMLDRFDSFLFGGIAFYFALWLVGFSCPHLQELMRAAQS